MLNNIRLVLIIIINLINSIGKAFECDCKVRWLAEWVTEYNLQITSRERNPQFCSKPSHLRNKPFTHIDINDFVCEPFQTSKTVDNKTPSSATTIPGNFTTTTGTTTTTHTFPSVHYEHSSTINLITSPPPAESSTSPSVIIRPATSYIQVVAVNEPTQEMKTQAFTVGSNVVFSTGSTEPKPKNVSKSHVSLLHQLPVSTLVVHEPSNESGSVLVNISSKPSTKPRHRSSIVANSHRILYNHSAQGSLRLLDAIYRNNSILLRWEPLGRPSNSGYRVIYRFFGLKEFHKSEPISGKQTSYSLSHFNAPNELVVICVVNLDDPNNGFEKLKETPIPSEQCRELTITRETILKKPNRMPSTTINNGNSTSMSTLYLSLKRLNDIDKIVIAISAAICLFIIIAVLVFSCCFYQSVSKESPFHTVLAATNAKCLSTKSLSPIAKSSLDHEWETVSVYSTRSIPRARIAAAHLSTHHTPPIPPPTITGTIRSHISSHVPSSSTTTAPMTRYFGSTLPTKPNLNRNLWPDPYLHHYPTPMPANHLSAVSYGTTVTATGGVHSNGYFSDSSNYVRNNYLALEYDRSRHKDRSTLSLSNNNNNNKSRSNHRSRKSSKSRSKSSNIKLMPSNSISELRIHSGGSNGSGGGGSGSSYNRLLLSSSSNSYQSQNEYDSDSNHHNNNNNHYNNSYNNWNVGPYGNPRMLGGAVSSRMNDNEVDIYIDQNYARRFI